MKPFLIVLFLHGLITINAQNKFDKIQTIPDSNPVYDFNLTKDSTRLYYFHDNNFIEYDLYKEYVVRKVKTTLNPPIISFVVLPCENKVLVGTKDGTVCLLDLNNETVLSAVNLNAGSINSLALIQNGDFCLCGTANGIIYKCRLTDLNDHQIFHQVSSEVTQIKTIPSESLITIIDGAGYLYCYDLITLESLEYFRVSKKWLRSHDYNSFKKLLLVAGDDGCLYTYKLKSDRTFSLISENKVGNNWITSAGFSHNGNMEYWGNMGHRLFAKSAFATLSTKLKGPIVKTAIVETNTKQIISICSVYGNGITIVPLFIMQNTK